MNCGVIRATTNQLDRPQKITEQSVEEIVTVLVVENSVCLRKITGRSNIATRKMEFVFEARSVTLRSRELQRIVTQRFTYLKTIIL